MQREDQGFINSQVNTLAGYIDRGNIQVANGLKFVISKCTGKTQKERRGSYLKFRDKDLQSVLMNIEGLGRIPKEVETNVYFFDILKGGIEW